MFNIDLTAEEAFEYGGIVASGLAGAWYGFKRWKKKIGKEKSGCSSCGLCKHELFAFLELQLRKVQHKNWRCCNEYKTRVAKRIIEHKFQVGISRWKVAFCSMQHSKTKEELMERFNEEIKIVVDLYNAKWMDEGINQSIIDQVNAYHDTNVRYSVRLAQMEIEKDYQDMRETLRNIMTMLIVPYTMFLADVRNLLDSANGELVGDIFEGVVNDTCRVNHKISRGRYSFDEEDL